MAGFAYMVVFCGFKPRSTNNLSLRFGWTCCLLLWNPNKLTLLHGVKSGRLTFDVRRRHVLGGV